jgi:acyl-homoserine lactone acylase PvdQ
MKSSLLGKAVFAFVLSFLFIAPLRVEANLLELLCRKTPTNGPVDTPVDSWSILAPGTGGLGAATCPMCLDEMYLYNDIVLADELNSQKTLRLYYKRSNIGLYSPPTFQAAPRALYPGDAMDELMDAFIQRGYDRPVTYVPPGTLHARIDWDAHHVPHIVGKTVEDVSYGLGYATVYSNMFEMLLFRAVGASGILQSGVGMSDLLHGGSINISELVADAKLINYTRDEMLDMLDPQACDEMLGPACQEMVSAMVAYREGINQAIKQRYPVFKLLESLCLPWPRWEVIDTAAIGLAIVGVFGDPGADQLSNLSLYRTIESNYGADGAQTIFDDYKLRHLPVDDTTVTAERPFPNPVFANGSNAAEPNRFVDPDSIAWLDMKSPEENVSLNTLLHVEQPHASNWMVISKERSSTGHPLLVGGPQMNYFRPNIFLEFDARTTDNQFQITGVSLPGLFIAAFAGNGHKGVWTPTSAMGKTADIFVEKLCSPDGTSPVDPQSNHYLHDGACKPMDLRKGQGIPFTVHGPVIARDTVDGEPVAVTRKSYNIERVAQGIIPYFALAKGRVQSARQFIDVMQHHTLALNYAYINASEVAYINTGLYPVRAVAAQSDLPIWGTGQWDWQGVISMDQRPHMINPEKGYMTSWNNQSAPGFYQGNGDFQRVQIIERLIAGESPGKTRFDLLSLAEVAQTTAVQDAYALTCLPLLTDYLNSLPTVEKELADMLTELRTWVETHQAKRVDLDEDGLYDQAGPAIMDEIMVSLKLAMEEHLDLPLGLLNLPGPSGSAYLGNTVSLIRMLLNRAKATGDHPEDIDPTLLQCGDGTFDSCRDLVIKAVRQVKSDLTAQFGTDDPALWLKAADHIELMPLNPPTKQWHWQNRPTFQQIATVQ